MKRLSRVGTRGGQPSHVGPSESTALAGNFGGARAFAGAQAVRKRLLALVLGVLRSRCGLLLTKFQDETEDGRTMKRVPIMYRDDTHAIVT